MHYGASVSEVADCTAATSHSSRATQTRGGCIWSAACCAILWAGVCYITISPAHVTFELKMSRLTFACSAGASAGPKMTDVRYRQTDRGHVEHLRWGLPTLAPIIIISCTTQ